MRSELFHNAKFAKVIKYTHTKGVDIGDYFFIVTDKDGNFVHRFGNRSYKDAIEYADTYVPKEPSN